MKGLSDLPSAVTSGNRTVRLYFVVPEDKFEAVTRPQSYLNEQHKVHQNLPVWIPNRVEQWVLGVDFTSGVKAIGERELLLQNKWHCFTNQWFRASIMDGLSTRAGWISARAGWIASDNGGY